MTAFDMPRTGRWYADSALEELLWGIPFPRVNTRLLCRGLDVLPAPEERLCHSLHQRCQSWFGIEFEFLLNDVAGTNFKAQALRNEKAARGCGGSFQMPPFWDRFPIER